jgi:hypothetical protein
MTHRHLAILVVAATLAACTTTTAPTSPHYWQAGDKVTDTFEQDTAKCELLVEQRYAVYGVAGSLLSVPGMKQTFGTCLEALGWHLSNTETREQQSARCDAQMAQLHAALKGKRLENEESLLRDCKTAPLAEIPTEREMRESRLWAVSKACEMLVAEGKRDSKEECIAGERRRAGDF